MLAFKYTKTDGAEYLSHLDLLRHIDRTLRRAGIEVAASGGFHPHAKIYMNNPLGLGIKSVAEFCAADCAFDGDFKEAFNANSPKGVKCTAFRRVGENPNYAYTIERCEYTAAGIAPFDVEKYLSRKEIIVTDKRGRTVDIRTRIFSLTADNGLLRFTLGCGANNLRPDLFCELLAEEFGGAATGLIKTESIGKFTF